MTATLPTRIKPSFILRLLGIFSFAVLSSLALCFYYAVQPQDLSDLKIENSNAPTRDLKLVLEKAIEGKYSVTLSEQEINQWLAHEMQGEQTGFLNEWVSVEAVLVRLRKGVAELIIERNFAGFPLTTSLFLQVEKSESSRGFSTQVHLHGGAFHKLSNQLLRGGRFGQLTVPQGFLMIIFSDFEKIAKALQPELRLGFEEMNQTRIEDKALFLDPNISEKEATNSVF